LLNLTFCLALLIIVMSGSSLAAKSSGCEGGAFSVLLSSGAISGDQSVSVPSGSIGSSFLVKGAFVEFTVDSATLAVRNYTLTGAANPEDLTGGRRTIVFASKSANLRGATLTSNLIIQLAAEGIVIQRAGAGVSMKLQANDCATGGIFQMEPERGDGTATIVTHVLGAGVFYFDNPNFRNPPPLPLCPAGGPFTAQCTPVPITPRINFANDLSPKFVGRDSPQVATRLVQQGGVSVWQVESGGRMGGVLGEDSVEVAPPAKPCTHKCQAQDRVRGRFPVLGFPFPVPAASRITP